MDQEGTFWVNCWRVLGMTLVGIAACITGCQGYQNYTVTKMVAGGADPMRAACAVGKEGLREACAILAAGRKEN